MRLVHETEGLAQPNVCALCNASPNRENGKRVIDTGFTRIAPRADVIFRNYVCESCGTEIANKLGFVSNDQAKLAFNAAKIATERLDSVRQKVQAAAEEIVQFAKDTKLTDERVAVEKWLEGTYVQQEVKKAPGRPRKVAESGDTPLGVTVGANP